MKGYDQESAASAYRSKHCEDLGSSGGRVPPQRTAEDENEDYSPSGKEGKSGLQKHEVVLSHRSVAFRVPDIFAEPGFLEWPGTESRPAQYALM